MSFLPLFPVIPSIDPIIERLEYKTDILEAWDGTEQRIGFRDKPFRFMEFVFHVLRLDKVILESGLYGNVSDDVKQWAIPIWQDLQFLTTQANFGDLHITVTTASRDFEDSGLNNQAVIISGSRLYDRERGLADYEFEQFDINTVNAETIDVDISIAKNWAVGSLILPVREGWLIDPISNSDPSNVADMYLNGRARFKLEAV